MIDFSSVIVYHLVLVTFGELDAPRMQFTYRVKGSYKVLWRSEGACRVLRVRVRRYCTSLRSLDT